MPLDKKVSKLLKALHEADLKDEVRHMAAEKFQLLFSDKEEGFYKVRLSQNLHVDRLNEFDSTCLFRSLSFHLVEGQDTNGISRENFDGRSKS